MPAREVTKTFVDKDTGQVLDLTTTEQVQTNRRGAVKVDEKFALVFPKSLVHKDLTMREMHVLLLLTADQNIETGVTAYSTTDIAAELGIAPSYVSLCFNTLQEKGCIERLRRGAIRVNPELLWRGSIKERRAWITERAIASAGEKKGSSDE